ncbi:MAG: integrase core domain-containing protein [Candidatus Methylomirabilales bacterium]
MRPGVPHGSHGELRMLGFGVSERTVSRWLQRVPRHPGPAQRWLAFVRNHRDALAAMDFLTGPTLTFGVLSGFFGIAHDRRRTRHVTVTRNPTSAWVVRQVREAFPDDSAPKYLLYDRDTTFGLAVRSAVPSLGSTPIRLAVCSPGQNGVAERWVGSCRGELPDHVIALDERHVKRLRSSYLRSYHEDRTHLGLGQQTPARRAAMPGHHSLPVVSHPRVGGLHHRYDLAA